MKTTSENKIVTVTKYIFVLAALLVLAYLIIGSIHFHNEEKQPKGDFGILSEGWNLIRENGEMEPIKLPGNYKAKRNEKLVLTNVLPDDVGDNLYLCIRSSKQEMEIYIDDVLRQEYSTKDTRPWGKVSAVIWIFVELKDEDAGKEIRIANYTDTSYTGQYYQVYYGEKWEIWSNFFLQSGAEMLIGLLMLILGVSAIVISIALKWSYKKNIEMKYLGIGIFMAAIWLLANSVFRQVIFPSISVISDMAFFMVMLMGIPFMLYLNDVQNQRYWKPYCILIGVILCESAIWTVLHVTNVVDFSDTIKYMGFFDAISVAFMTYTIFRDIWSKKIKEYRMVSIGIAALCVVAILEIVIYFYWPTYFNGSVIAIGLVIMLVISFINTMKDVLNTEKDKQKALMASEAKGKFLSNMSHEIRTPINAVLGMDAMILRECEDENIREYAMNIQNAGQTLLSLINDILDFSKIESGKMEIIPVEYDFSSMIHDVVNMIMMKANDKGLQMHVSVDSTLPFKVYGDEVRIRQVLINLLTNAVKYTIEGSISLVVFGKKEGENVQITFEVTDTGIGIKEEDIGKLFRRFERIEEERNRNIEGTGLGMSITLQLLKLMNSELNVQSTYGKGSTFSFTLNQKIVEEEPIGDLEERIKKMPSEFHYTATFVAPDAHILVVDDNMMNRKVFCSLLKQTKCCIDEAESGMDCLELVKENKYDIIFLDHMMPQMDGIETLHHMKEISEFPCKDTPVIALTANAISGAREMYLKEGFDDFLSKPIQPEKLEMMIAHYLPKELLKTEEKVVKEETEESLPNIEGIDYESAMQHIPDKEMLLETIHDFYMTLDGEANALEEFYDTLKDNEESLNLYRIKVHAMKSSAALIGAVSLSEQAKTLEYAARDKELNLILQKTQAFLNEWRSFKEKLSILFPQEEKVEIFDMSEIIDKLENLKSAMEFLDVDTADELMNDLRHYQYSEEISIKMEELSQSVVNLDSEGAAILVEEILSKI